MEIKFIESLDERSKRLFLATMANHFGKRGITLVAAASGINTKTIYRGIRELRETRILQAGRIRNIGVGRRILLQTHPEYLDTFDTVVKSQTAGLLQDDSVRWLNLTTAQIKEKLKERNIELSDYHVRHMVSIRGFKKR